MGCNHNVMLLRSLGWLLPLDALDHYSLQLCGEEKITALLLPPLCYSCFTLKPHAIIVKANITAI